MAQLSIQVLSRRPSISISAPLLLTQAGQGSVNRQFITKMDFDLNARQFIGLKVALARHN